MLELRELRRKAGVSQVEMAVALGLTQPSYSMKERGFFDFKAGEIRKLAEVLHLSMEQVNSLFFNGTVEGPVPESGADPPDCQSKGDGTVACD